MDELLHGSTIAINTVLEKSGARTALITTQGFRDVYAIGRGNRSDAFNFFFHRPRPLVPRELTFELRERMNAADEILLPIDVTAVEAIGRELMARGRARRQCATTVTRQGTRACRVGKIVCWRPIRCRSRIHPTSATLKVPNSGIPEFGRHGAR